MGDEASEPPAALGPQQDDQVDAVKGARLDAPQDPSDTAQAPPAEESGAAGGSTEGGETSAPAPASEGPTAWVMVYDPATSHPYYFNPSTGQSSWAAPEGATIAPSYGYPRAPPEPAPAPVAAPQLPSELERLHKALERVEGQAGGIEEAPPDSGEGPDGGWVELLDEGTGQPYYYHTGTLKTQWERPEGFEGESQAAFDRPQPHDATHPLSIYEDYKFQASLNKLTGRLQVGGGTDRDWDRDLRQLSHFMDVGKLEEMKRRRDAALEGVDWKAVREEQKVKKKRRQLEWLYKE